MVIFHTYVKLPEATECRNEDVASDSNQPSHKEAGAGALESAQGPCGAPKQRTAKVSVGSTTLAKRKGKTSVQWKLYQARAVHICLRHITNIIPMKSMRS